MKQLLVILILATSITSCQNESRDTFIPSYSKEFKIIDGTEVSNKLLTDTKFAENLTKELNQILSTYSGADEKLNFEYIIYSNSDGSFAKLKVIKSTSPDLDKIIYDKIKNWKFATYQENGTDMNYQFQWEFAASKNSANKYELTYSSLPTVGLFGKNNDSYYIQVEQAPEIIGGIIELSKNIVYPAEAKKAGIQGKVFVKAFINENGDVEGTKILKGVGNGLDEAATQAIMQTKFKPGMIKGKAVKCEIAIPIMFKLQ
ncbi:MAG: energy transducer TonB [Melioribacteraceae bacterium]|nr:energy transducer TonB [Melioribacteraceae bacterium]